MRPAPVAVSAQDDTAIVVEDERPQPETPAAPEAREQVTEPASGGVSEGLVAARIGPPAPSPSSVPEGPETTEPPAPSGSAWAFSPTAPMDLGIGSYWKRVATADSAPRPSPSVDEYANGAVFARRLSDDLRAQDVATGNGIAGPLVSAAHDAASTSAAPDVGGAVIELESDASGAIVSARVVDASGDRADWEEVAQRIRRQMAHKPLRVPSGAHGLRAHVRIVAERTLPSGERTSVHSGAAPDDACEGSGSTKRCTAGMPGAGGTWGDLANIGAKRSRVVHVQLLDEMLL